MARLPGKGGQEEQALLLHCEHMDVVPAGAAAWEVHAFVAESKNGRVYGRGASDMESRLPVMPSPWST